MSKITYTNKTALYENNDIADINKVKADDMNEIKACVNNNDDMLTGGAVAGDMVVNSIKTKNLFDKNSTIRGFVIASNGAINGAGGYCYCDYIKVKPSTQYTISLTNGNSGDPMRIAEYTSTKIFIDRPITSGNAPWIFTTPSNCEYIRLSYQYVNSGVLINTNIQLEEGSSATAYSEYQALNGVSHPTNLFIGEKYIDNDTITLSEPIQTGHLYAFTCRGVSSSYDITLMCLYNGETGIQIAYANNGGGTFEGFRYRFALSNNNSTLTIQGTGQSQNNASNTAILRIDKIL